MPELEELMGDIPESLLGEDEAPAGGGAADDAGAATTGDDEELEQPAGGDLADPTEEAEQNEDDDEEPVAGEDDEPAGDEEEAVDDEESDDDYVTSIEDDEPATPTTPAASTDTTPPGPTDESSYILSKLNKIAVRILMPGDKEGENKIETVEVYGYGDLPRDYLGFATPYEAGVFSQSVVAQENKAAALQAEYRNNKTQQDLNDYTRKENAAVAEDLTQLRKEGLFAKFKGEPGSKEFNSSEGAKQFDEVMAFMNERNRQYQREANNGKAYRHIGFREAFEMLYGPNPQASAKRAQASRRAAASRLTTSRGTSASTKPKVSARPVQNLTDLQDEFAVFSGQGAKS